MEKKRHIHADYIIMQANDMSLRFDYKDKRTGNWVLCQESPCEFNPNWEYRRHEREFPKTSLDLNFMSRLWNNSRNNMGTSNALLEIANAAIKQYILDTEKESK